MTPEESARKRFPKFDELAKLTWMSDPWTSCTYDPTGCDFPELCDCVLCDSISPHSKECGCEVCDAWSVRQKQIEDYDNAVEVVTKDPDDKPLCSSCNGSGLGRLGDPDTSKCMDCGGKGVESAEEEYPERDYYHEMLDRELEDA